MTQVMSSNYLTLASKTQTKKMAFSKLVMSFLAMIVLASGTIVSTNAHSKAEAFDPTQWFMCLFGDDSAPAQIYNATQSPLLQYNLLSKSAISSGVSQVDSGWNTFLALTGPDFKKVNEKIIGVSLDPEKTDLTDDESEKTEKPKYNAGSKVNPYDRFGFAGLNFTSYAGEWKYIYVNACQNSDPQDPKSNLYYEERLEPRSTWEDRSKSNDPRTIQHSRELAKSIDSAFLNTIANLIFGLTKGVIGLTISFTNLAFSDLSETLGFNDIVVGSSNNTGIIKTLFSNFFTPLIVIAIMFTGARVAYLGLWKKAYRESLTSALVTVLMFILAIVISTTPSLITLPNKAVVFGQSIIIQSMNTGTTGGDGICETEIGNQKTETGKSASKNPEVKEFAAASANMSSAISCSLWKTFLLQPWSEGQFGADWNELWAKGEMPKNAKGKELNNTNGEWVGNAEIPLGGGKTMNNWAFFHISSLTNAHAPLGKENERTRVSQGVSTDWWRIVDALSNYDEKEYTFNAQGNGGQQNQVSEVTYAAPMGNEPLQEWDTWVGNNEMSRIWSAMSSLPIAIFGVLALFVFSFMSAVYGIGITILMAFLPIMLLFACWSGKGFEIFKGYLNLVFETMISRVIMAILLILAILLTQSALNLMDEVGWFQGTLVFILVSFILIKNKEKILNLFKGFSLSTSADFSQTAHRITSGFNSAVKGTARTATVATASGIAGKRHGMSFTDGAIAGAKNELRNKMYTTQTTREMMTQYELTKNKYDPHAGDNVSMERCASCGAEIESKTMTSYNTVYYRDSEGNYYCQDCGEDGVQEDLYEVLITPEQRSKPRAKPTRKKASQKNFMDNKSRSDIENVLNYNKDRNDYETVKNSAERMLNWLNVDVNTHRETNRNRSDYSEEVFIPAELMKYFREANMIDDVRTAWSEGRYEFIKESYTLAMIMWIKEKSGHDLSKDIDILRQASNTNPEFIDDNEDDSDNEEPLNER